MFDALRVFASAHLARADPRAQSYLHAKTRLARGKALPCRVLFFAGHTLCVAERKYSTDYFHRFLKLHAVGKRAENSFQLPAFREYNSRPRTTSTRGKSSFVMTT